MRLSDFTRSLLVLALALSATNGWAARQAQILKPVTPNTAAQLCPQIAPPCDAKQTQLLKSATGTQYLLDNSKPALIALKSVAPKVMVSTYSDLSNYPNLAQTDANYDWQRQIYPALYPVGVNGWAIALVQRTSWPYAGGGGSVETADFVPFTSQPALADNVLYRSVPFGCSQIIRACFLSDENDNYDKSPHCRDESYGSLRIKYPDQPVGDKADWTLIWSEYKWPAHVAKSRATRSQKTFTLPAQFCEAP